MAIRRLLRPSNRRVRLIVGLFLAGLFCIQCTTTDTFSTSNLVSAIAADKTPQKPDLEKLAREDHVALLELCLDRYHRSVQDYRCTFIKQERIRGVLGPEQWIDVKFLDNPFSVAMHWTRNIPIGETALYVEGEYDGNMLVKPKGFLAKVVGTVERKPTHPEVMKNTLRPITEFGFERALVNLRDVYVAARKAEECTETFGGYADVAGRKAIVLIRYLPEGKGYPAYKTVTFIDVERLLPLGLEGYDANGQLDCRYYYKDVELNPGLTATDFLPEANGMAPPQ